MSWRQSSGRHRGGELHRLGVTTACVLTSNYCRSQKTTEAALSVAAPVPTVCPVPWTRGASTAPEQCFLDAWLSAGTQRRTSWMRLWLLSQSSATSSVVEPAGSLGSFSAVARNVTGLMTLGEPLTLRPLGDLNVCSCAGQRSRCQRSQ